jgi:hypothetical protein
MTTYQRAMRHFDKAQQDEARSSAGHFGAGMSRDGQMDRGVMAAPGRAYASRAAHGLPNAAFAVILDAPVVHRWFTAR